MMDFMPVEVMWRVALAAIPLALLVALIGRAVPCRPATRHLLWVGVVVILICTPFIPAMDVPDAPELRRTASDLVNRAAQLLPDRSADAPASRTQPGPMASAPDRGAPSVLDPPAAEPDLGEFPRDVALDAIAQRFSAIESAGADRLLTSPPSARQPDMMSAAFFESPRDAAAPIDWREPTLPRDFDRSFVLNDAFSSTTEKARSEAPEFTPSSALPASSLPDLAAAPPDAAKIGVDEPESSSGPVEPGSAGVSAGESASAWTRWLAAIALLRDAVLSLPPMPASIWLGGIALLGLIVVLKLGESLRLMRLGSPAPGWVIDEVTAAATDLNVRRMPETLMVDARVSPMVWCGRTPRLILPTRLWDQLDEEGRAAVLYHELAHLRRHDHWVSWADLAAGILYWWHPVVWWVRRRLREEADLSCDAWVTALRPHGRRAYAQALLQTKKYTSALVPVDPAPGVVGLGVSSLRARTFARRITMVMTEHKSPGLSVRGIALAVLLVLIGCIVTPIWACPPESKDKAAQDAKAEKVRVIAPGATQDKKAGDSTFERYMNDRDDDDDDDADVLEVHAPHGAIQAAPSKVRITTKGSRGCCDGDCCKGCQCGSEVRVSGAVSAHVAGNAHTHIVSGDRIYCNFKGSCPVKDGGHDGQVVALTTAGPIVAQSVSDAAAICTAAAPGAAAECTAAIVAGEGVSITAPQVVAVHQNVGHAVQSFLVAADEDEAGDEITRAYKLPQGKLEDLTRLMARDDVPVLIRRQGGSIEVIGTARQHAIFRAFVNMIHPGAAPGEDDIVVIEVEEGADVQWDDDEDEWDDDEDADDDDEEAEAAWERERDVQRHELERRRDEVHRQVERQREEAERRAENAARQLERQVRQIQRERERAETRVHGLQEKAESYRQKAEESRHEADELEDQAEEAETERDISRLLEKAAQLQVKADQYEAQAEQCETEVEAISEQAEAMEYQVEAVHEQHEEMVRQIEEMIESLEHELEAMIEQIEREMEEIEARRPSGTAR